MQNLIVYKTKKEGMFYKLIHGQHPLKMKESKSDWPCMHCSYNTSRDCDVFQLSNETKFRRVCISCMKNMSDFIDFCFGKGTSQLCIGSC